jgi:hypothetical protein
VEDRIEYFEQMLADKPDNPTGLWALANEYDKATWCEDEAAVLKRYVTTPSTSVPLDNTSSGSGLVPC